VDLIIWHITISSMLVDNLSSSFVDSPTIKARPFYLQSSYYLMPISSPFEADSIFGMRDKLPE